MIKLCPQCIYYRRRPSLRIVQSGSGSSPGRINAATEELRVERERRDTEQRRIDEEYRFDYEPSFFPWCDRFTPSDKDIWGLRKTLMEGGRVDEIIRTAQTNGHEFFIDPSQGVIGRVFALCRRKNPNGDCDEYKTTLET